MGNAYQLYTRKGKGLKYYLAMQKKRGGVDYFSTEGPEVKRRS